MSAYDDQKQLKQLIQSNTFRVSHRKKGVKVFVKLNGGEQEIASALNAHQALIAALAEWRKWMDQEVAA